MKQVRDIGDMIFLMPVAWDSLPSAVKQSFYFLGLSTFHYGRCSMCKQTLLCSSIMQLQFLDDRVS